MIRTYSAPEGAMLRDEFLVRVRPLSGGDWTTLDTYRVKVDMHDVREASMVIFDMDEPVEVEVSVKRFYSIYTASIRPLSYGIEPHYDDAKKLTFVLDKPASLSVELNKERFHNLHVFAGAIEDEERFKAEADLVIDAEGQHRESFAPNDALAALPAGKDGRRTLFVGPGCYDIEDMIWHIPSHTDVYLAGGAVLKGGLVIDHAEDVHVHGRGVLDLAFMSKQTGAGGIGIDSCRDIELSGMVIVNPPHYSVCAGASQGIAIHNVKAFSCEGWGDGIDMMSCQDVLIEGCFLRNSDDCLAMYGSRWDWRGDTRNVTVRDCTLWADVAHPINIGTHGDHEHEGDIIEHLLFERIDVLEHHEYQMDYLGVMAINVGDKNTARDITFRDFHIEPFEHGRVLDFEVRWNPTYNPAPGRRIENITVENIDVTTGDGEEPSLIHGFDADHPVEGVHIINMRRDGVRCATLQAANIQVGDFAGDIDIA